MPIVNKLIHTYKTRKKRQFLRQPLFQSRRQYAFIGVGAHSLANLYPVLRYFNIPLKWICTRSSDAAEQVAAAFPGARATHDLEDILRDPEVAGVFVCTTGTAHFSIARQLLKAGKQVFLEKPPCYALSELDTLIAESKGLNCFMGLQKRFGTVNSLLAGKIKSAYAYHAVYGMGPYPEGDPVYELFIHPVDNCIRLFGKARIQLLKNVSPSRNAEFLLVLEHPHATGTLELSTAYNWSNPVDSLTIHTSKEILTAEYPNFLQGEERSTTIAGIPFDKIGNKPLLTRTYLHNNGTIPSLENNSLHIQGFYGAISHFVQAVEHNTIDEAFQPGSLQPVYEILDALRQTSKDPDHV